MWPIKHVHLTPCPLNSCDPCGGISQSEQPTTQLVRVLTVFVALQCFQSGIGFQNELADHTWPLSCSHAHNSMAGNCYSSTVHLINSWLLFKLTDTDFKYFCNKLLRLLEAQQWGIMSTWIKTSKLNLFPAPWWVLAVKNQGISEGTLRQSGQRPLSEWVKAC